MPDGTNLYTKRLRGEPLSSRHERLLVGWWSDPEFAEALGGPRSPDDVRARMGVALAHWREQGYGSWIFRDRTSGEPVGWAGLGRTRLLRARDGSLMSARHDDRASGGDGTEAVEIEAVEIYYAVVPERRRQGYGAEAASRVVRHAEELGIVELVAFILPRNIASRALARSLGFRCAGGVEHAGRPHLLYRCGPGSAAAESG